MATNFEKSANPHSTVVTLSHTEYRRHFGLGYGTNIASSPSQRLQSFVGREGFPYRFVVVGRLMSFKVVEDAFGHYIFVNVGQFEHPSSFTDMFTGQLVTLKNIEEMDGLEDPVEAQNPEWRSSNDQLALRAYNIRKYSLSSADIGSFIVAVAELRCLDVSRSESSFFRSYWIEALSLRSLTSHDPLDEELVENVNECWRSLSCSFVCLSAN